MLAIRELHVEDFSLRVGKVVLGDSEKDMPAEMFELAVEG
jgi:hypothetical protein